MLGSSWKKNLRKKWRRCRIDTINELYKSIAAGLKAVKSCTVYLEDVPQNFKTPSFMVTIYDQNPSRGINGRLKNEVSLDVLYFPENKGRAELQEECWSVGQALTREFAAPGFKIKNRNLKIEDNVLHFMFDVDYREYNDIPGVKMRTQTIDERIKEE